jgi:TetR/AcrR family transcriptional regulator, transcriptional repressor of bet genes
MKPGIGFPADGPRSAGCAPEEPSGPGPSGVDRIDERQTERRSRLRAPAEIRQRHLIGSCVDTLARHDGSEITVRLVAREAGVSPGLITHHFGGIEKLLIASASSIADEMASRFESWGSIHTASPPGDRRAFLDACFRPPLTDDRTLRAWHALARCAASAEPIVRIRSDFRRRLLAALSKGIGLPGGEVRHGAGAAMLLAVIEGFWIQMVESAAPPPDPRVIDRLAYLVVCDRDVRTATCE